MGLIQGQIASGAPVWPFPSFWGFTASTPSIPQLYWDVKSAEQRWKEICCDLKKVIEYADLLGVDINDLYEQWQSINEQVDQIIDAKIEDLQKQMDAFEAEVMRLIEEIQAGLSLWNVQQGRYTTSKVGMRDMFNDVTFMAYTIDDYDSLGEFQTVDELAESGFNVAGWAVVNSARIENVTSQYLYSEGN